MKHVAEFYTKILFILCLDLNKREELVSFERFWSPKKLSFTATE